MNPDYDPPELELVRTLRWEWTEHDRFGELTQLYSRRRDRWVLHQPWTHLVFEGLEEGAGFQGLVDRLSGDGEDRYPPATARAKVGRLVFGLYLEGYLDMAFPPPPDRFGDRFEVLEELGRGGVGVAWRCRDAGHDDEVVVKHAWDYFRPLERADEAMRREASAVEAMDHPGVISFREAFEVDGVLHLAREFVDGVPLVDVEQLSLDARIDIGRQVLGVVEHLHERGFLMLDMAPANFLVTSEDRIVLVDLGLCVPHEDGAVELKTPVGAPGFQAPEVRSEQRATAASMVEGVGRLLFSLSAGRRPRKGWTGEDLAERLGEDPIAAVVAKLCAVEPAARPGIDEAADLLGGLVDA